MMFFDYFFILLVSAASVVMSHLYQGSQSWAAWGPMLERNYLHILSNFLVTYGGRMSVDFVTLSWSETDFSIYFFNAVQSNNNKKKKLRAPTYRRTVEWNSFAF